jgi:hypothetical protein
MDEVLLYCQLTADTLLNATAALLIVQTLLFGYNEDCSKNFI